MNERTDSFRAAAALPPAALQARLRAVGYEADRATALAVRALLTQPTGQGARALLLAGPPGAGKTALAEALARVLGADLVFALLHAWSADEDLFGGVDVRAAVAGEAEHVRQPGVLARAAEASHRGPVVLCLDEVDKAPESTEGLLLDWLQSGRVPVRPGEHLQADLGRVLVVLTTNGTRPHTDALLRRCRRLRLRPPAGEVRLALAARRSGAPAGVLRLLDRLDVLLADLEGREPVSLQELAHAARECHALAESAADVRAVCAAWLARTPEGEAALASQRAALIGRLPAAIWGEVVAARRRAEGAA